MPRVPLKKRPKVSEKSDVRKLKSAKVLPIKKKPKRISDSKASWVAVGIDLSLSSLSGAAFGYDRVLKREVGPVFSCLRWQRGEHDYFRRLSDLARGNEFTLDLIGQLKMLTELNDVHIAIEEPWPFGMSKKLESNILKQQSQISGCFIGSLLRWGWQNISEINNTEWRRIVADDLGLKSQHWTVYGKGLEGKMRTKEWALKSFDVEDWPDLIQHNKQGLIPRPETSRAKAQQPDDRYDALAIASWMRKEIEKGVK